MARFTLRMSAALAVAALLGSCATAEDTVADSDERESLVQEEVETPAPEPPRVAPDWEQSESVADFSRCKLKDPRPAWQQELVRGQTANGVLGRENVGFPRSEREIPGLGEGNVIMAKVAFNDAPPSDRLADDFLERNKKILEDWSDFWSQGRFRWNIQVVDGWVEVPINHADYPIDPGVGDNEYDQEEFYRLMNERTNEISRLVVAEFPDTLDYAAADAILVYWSPEMFAFKQTVGARGAVFNTPQGRFQIPFQAGGISHTTDTGQLTFEIKQEYAWSYFLHDLMHWQGMNGHAPGNGWRTGVGQGAYPANGMFSGAIAAWEAFLFEWYDDSQVFCADLESVTVPERVILTPLEIYGGERKMIAIRTVDYKLIVVESRRPIGYSEDWPSDYSGLLVYEVDADGQQMDHLPDDCGNDPDKPKWAYYLYPDSVSDTTCVENDVGRVLVKEGMSVTHSGIRISLEYSGDEADYVTVERVSDES